ACAENPPDRVKLLLAALDGAVGRKTHEPDSKNRTRFSETREPGSRDRLRPRVWVPNQVRVFEPGSRVSDCRARLAAQSHLPDIASHAIASRRMYTEARPATRRTASGLPDRSHQ